MAAKSRLEQHYDSKYGAEAGADPKELVRYTDYPSNRFEACLKFFGRRFTGGNILELGAGSGLIARSLIADGLRFDSYTLSELSDARLQGLKRGFEDPRIHTMKLDIDTFAPSDQRFDAVLMVAVIEHLIDPLGALTKLRGLLAPGGLVFIDTPNIAKFTRRAKLMFGRFPSTASHDEGLVNYAGTPVDLYDEGHLHYFTYRSLATMLVERCGFERVEMFGYFIGPGRRLLGSRISTALATAWPTMFSEVALAAYA